MSLAEVPLLFMLVGLAAYAVLGGADYGAGLWQLVDARPGGERRRELVHRAMAAVWEANHVWLIFVLVVFWTAYPVPFASVASTLAAPFFLAAVGIILRGLAYAVRAGARSAREAGRIDLVFAASSILTPFALGAMVGAIASERVPVGNAAGGLWESWVAPMPLYVGALTVAAGAYMAAVFLAGDARRMGQAEAAETFRARALASGVATGALAAGGVAVARIDAERVYAGLTSGAGLVALVASAAGGVATLALVWRRAFEPARATAAAAVAAIVAGWAIAQDDFILPGLSVAEAAAGRATLVAVVVGVLAGSLILFPSLALLFRMVLRGRFDPMAPATAAAAHARPVPAPREARGTLLLAVALTAAALALFGGDVGEPVGIVVLLVTVPAAALWLLLRALAGSGSSAR